MAAKMGSNVMDNIGDTIIDANKEFVGREGESRSTEDGHNAGGRGCTRAALPCLPRTTRCRATNDEEPVTMFDDGVDSAFQSLNA